MRSRCSFQAGNGAVHAREPGRRPSSVGSRLALLGVAVAWLAGACGGGGGSGSTGPDATPTPAVTPTPGFARSLGFVVDSFGFMFPETSDSGCPDGFNRGPIELASAGLPVPPDDCVDPGAAPDPGCLTLQSSGTLDGFDLDDELPHGGGDLELVVAEHAAAVSAVDAEGHGQGHCFVDVHDPTCAQQGAGVGG